MIWRQLIAENKDVFMRFHRIPVRIEVSSSLRFFPYPLRSQILQIARRYSRGERLLGEEDDWSAWFAYTLPLFPEFIQRNHRIPFISRRAIRQIGQDAINRLVRHQLHLLYSIAVVKLVRLGLLF